MQRTSWLKCLLVVGAVGCVEPVEGPAPGPVLPPPDFLATVIETGIFVDWGGAYLGLTLMLDRGQPNLFYVNYELEEVRYAGCPTRCDDPRFWVRGTPDTSRWALESNAGGAAGMDSSGRIHAIYGRRFYGTCPGRCDAKSNWTSVRLDSNLTTNLALSVAPDGALHALSIVPGLIYATCAADCTVPGNWQQVQIATDATPVFRVPATAIARDAQGRLHVVYPRADGQVLVYGTCGGNCLDPQSWSFMAVDSTRDGFAFGLTTSGNAVHLVRSPRGLLTSRVSAITYSTCTANCTSLAGWQTTNLGELKAVGGAAIAVKSDGTRAIAVGGAGVNVLTCAASCELPGAWTHYVFDTLPDYPDYSNVESVAITFDANGDPAVARYGWGLVKYFQRNR